MFHKISMRLLMSALIASLLSGQLLSDSAQSVTTTSSGSALAVYLPLVAAENRSEQQRGAAAQDAAVELLPVAVEEAAINPSSGSLSEHIFFPLVQSGLAAEVNAADNTGPLPTGSVVAGYQFSFKDYVWTGYVQDEGFVTLTQNHAWVDASGALHLKPASGTCIRLGTVQVFHFGQFQWQVSSQLSSLELGLAFSTAPQVSFYSGWDSNPVGEYSVNDQTYAFSVLNLGQPPSSTHRLSWKSRSMLFQSLAGTSQREFANWTFGPRNPLLEIPQQPVPVRMRFCANAAGAEAVIQQFTFVPF